VLQRLSRLDNQRHLSSILCWHYLLLPSFIQRIASTLTLFQFPFLPVYIPYSLCVQDPCRRFGNGFIFQRPFHWCLINGPVSLLYTKHSIISLLTFEFPQRFCLYWASWRIENERSLKCQGNLWHVRTLCFPRRRQLFSNLATSTMAEPTKQETDQVFKILKSQKANKVQNLNGITHFRLRFNSLALIVVLEIQPGRVSHLAFTSVWSVPVCIGIWAYTSASFGMLICVHQSCV